MNERKPDGVKFVTRSIVRNKLTPTTNYEPDIAVEMQEYVRGQLQTRSIVREKIPLAIHARRPYLQMTIGLNEEAKLTYDQAMTHAQQRIQAVIALVPDLRLAYSGEHSSVQDGKLVAALVPQMPAEGDEKRLRQLLADIHAKVAVKEGATNVPAPAFALSYLTLPEAPSVAV